MIAVISEDDAEYVSPVFAIKKAGWLSEVLAFEALSDWPEERHSAYLRAFFVYGFFGVVYQWIKYDFDETPEEVQRHTAEVVLRAAREERK